MALASCNKDNYVAVGEGGEIEITFNAGPLSVMDDSGLTTRVSHSTSGNKTTSSWEDGDQISMVFYNAPGGDGVKSSTTHVANTSSRRFTTTGDGNFTGKINTDELAVLGNEPDGSSNRLNCFAIYPATDLTVSSNSSGGSFNYYTVTGPVIPDVQDGTGWPYCYFVSTSGLYSRVHKKFMSGAKSFLLSNTLVKFRVTNSSKDIKNIQITTDASCLVGNVTYWIGHTSSQSEFAVSSNGRAINQAGCPTKTLNIRNGGVLPSEILFSCRLFKGNVTFTFTATDDSYCTLKNTISGQMLVDGNQRIYNIGDINLGSVTWK